MQYTNSVAWVTGASAGIGEALAKELNSRGAKVIISARREEKLEDVKESAANPDDMYVLPLDLADIDSLKQKTEEALGVYGHIDYLFNNGGVSQRSMALDTDISVVEKIMKINFLGTVELTRHVAKDMVKRESGHIVVTSSVMGKFGTEMRSTYAASKHSLHGYFDCLRQELFPYDVHVTLCCPGYIHTKVSENALTADGSKYNVMSEGQRNGMKPEEFIQKFLRGVAKKKQEFYVGGSEVFAIYVKRLFPRLFYWIIRRMNTT